MTALFPNSCFKGFGLSRLHPFPEPPFTCLIQGARSSVLRGKLQQLGPRCPGVYGMLNDRGELIYVGKAKCLRKRLLCYFRRRSRDPKAGHILSHARAIFWEHVPSEFGALLRELELIRQWRPRFNVHGQPGRRLRTYVCLGRRPAPYLFLSRWPTAGVLARFGPIPAGQAAREAVRRLNDWYRLRDCPQSQPLFYAEQRELFPIVRAAGCLRQEIGTCLAPCIGACTRSEYAAQVRASRSFLEGTSREPLQVLENDMTEAAARLAFERAGALRDKLEAIRWLHDQLDRLRRMRDQQSFVYPVPGQEGRDLWYLIQHGRIAHVLPPPRDSRGRRDAIEALEKVYNDRRVPTASNPDEIDVPLLVYAWFRRNPHELQRTLLPADALVLLKGKTAASLRQSRSPRPPSRRRSR